MSLKSDCTIAEKIVHSNLIICFAAQGVVKPITNLNRAMSRPGSGTCVVVGVVNGCLSTSDGK